MTSPPSRGLPPRIYVPIVLVSAAAFIGVLAYFLRIGLGVTGSALGPSSGAVAGQSTVPPVASRAPGEAAVPQSGGVPTAGARELPPGNRVGGGGPAAGPPAPVVRMLNDFRARLARNPRDRDALLGLAGLYADAGKAQRAAPLYARAVALDPTDADARTSYAETLSSAGKPAEALMQLRRALSNKPDFPRALFDEGSVAADLGLRAQAVAALRRFLAVAPNDPRAQDARSALVNLGAS